MKNRCQSWCLKSSICSRPRENIKFRGPMKCINYCIQCLQGFSFSECGMRIHSSPPRVMLCSLSLKQCLHQNLRLCDHNHTIFFLNVRWDSTKRERQGELQLVSVAPLWIISRYICHVSPAHDGSNGAPWPGLCALLSALWKSLKDSRKKHILTHAADIHLALDTAGSDLSPPLNNNMVDRNHSARLSSPTAFAHEDRRVRAESHLVWQTYAQYLGPE